MAQIDTLTNVGAVVSTDLALILRGGANVLGTLGSMVGQNSSAVTITGGSINGLSGNFGIGGTASALTSGANTMLIKGTVTSKGGAIVLESSDASVRAYAYASSAGLAMGTLTAQPLLLVTGGVTGATLDTSGNLDVVGALSKGSGSFKIDHPLKPETHYLVHSFTESPQADLYYRGRVALVAGRATVNIDEVTGMTEGTFEALCGDVQCLTSNETGFDQVRGTVLANILAIECESASSDAVSWMVIGERKDQHMIDTNWTDENGHVIVEPEKLIEALGPQ